MKYTNVKNLQWYDAAHTMLNCSVAFEKNDGTFTPFCAMEKDCTKHGVKIWAECNSGVWGDIADYVIIILTDAEKALAELEAYDSTLSRDTEDAYQAIVDGGLTLGEYAQAKLDTKVALRAAYLTLLENK